MYKECYQSCKYCYGEGNAEYNNCTECKSNYTFMDEFGDTNCYEKCKYYYYFNDLVEYTCTEENKCLQNYNLLIKEKNQCINHCKNDIYYL